MLMDCSTNVIFPNSPTDDYSKPLPIPNVFPSSILPMSLRRDKKKHARPSIEPWRELETFEDRSDLASPHPRSFEDCYENVGELAVAKGRIKIPIRTPPGGGGGSESTTKRGQEYRGR